MYRIKKYRRIIIPAMLVLVPALFYVFRIYPKYCLFKGNFTGSCITQQRHIFVPQYSEALVTLFRDYLRHSLERFIMWTSHRIGFSINIFSSILTGISFNN